MEQNDDNGETLNDLERLRKHDEEILNDANYEHPNLTGWEKHRRKRSIRKTKKLFRAIDILFALSQNACPYVNKDNIKTINVQSNIVYDRSLSSVCKLDFYRTKSDEKQPAIILIHGGGFSAGDKKYRKGRSQFFALHGFSVFCVNYGLAPQYTFPDPLKHIVAAANFIYDNADVYNIDRERIFVGGDSAGAYYAAMMGAFNCSDKLKSAFGFSPKFKVFGALLNCGIYDMRTVLDTRYPFGLSNGVVLSMTGVKPVDFDTYKYRDVCVPSELVGKDYPPTFVIYSDNDIFCRGQGDVMLDVLNENGVYNEYFSARYSGSNHCFSLTWNGDDAAAANELLLSFAKRLAEDKIKLK
ncbi:MAG: alpha/beta hydrolase [Clostridiales bacterium]|nr:alpha/beta hydrolase [Clostridiales bacterium]